MLQVNSRGAKSKSLRAKSTGFESAGNLRAQSASVIGYHETWRITDSTTLPVFTRDDVLGSGPTTKTSGRVQGIEGRTQYITREVLDGGNILQGDFSRDQNRLGTFRLVRSGSKRALESDGRSPNQKAEDRAREQLLEESNRLGGQKEQQPRE